MPLIINDKIIEKLSGPNQMYYLVSKKGYSPLILFGDVHGSDQKQCGKNEYKLYSDEFLKLLDSLPYDVNLFVETWLRKKDYGPNERTFQHFRKEEFSSIEQLIPALTYPRIACYIKELRGSELYFKYCPTKNIKWHNIDARFAQNLVYDKQSYKSKKRDFEYTEFKTFSAFNEIEKIIKRYYDGNNLDKKFFVRDIFQDLLYETYIDGFYMLQLFLDIEKPSKLFDALLKDNNSIINKQMRKVNINPTKNLLTRFYKKEFLEKYEVYKPEYMIEFISEIILLLETEGGQTHIDNLQKMLDDKDEIEEGWSKHDLIVAAFTDLMKLTSVMLDLYFTFRMLKGGDITIGVLGNAHSESISKLLTKDYLNLYEIKEEVIGEYTGDKHTAQRCLTMPNIDLDKIKENYSILNPSFKISKRRSVKKISKRRSDKKTSKRRSDKKTSKRRSVKKTSKRRI